MTDVSRVTYSGPYGAVVIPLPEGGAIEIARGESAEVPADLAARLLAQPDFSADVPPGLAYTPEPVAPVSGEGE